MASDRAYLDYIIEQLPSEGVTFRPMMGEYILYYKGRVFGGIYDDRFLVKPVAGARALLPDAPFETPYEGAKDMLLIEDTDNRGMLAELLEAMYPELPEPKKKRKKTAPSAG